ncbi:MAG: bifunctional glutamate N-acetyltransferase/amino-acid acetyltransferase ArgJ [Alphaproteobacteria bacterium]
MKLSPLAPKNLPIMPPIDGVEILTCASGLHYQGRDDIMLMVFAKEKNFIASGVFTTSTTKSYPVVWCSQNLKTAKARAVICNAGNANAFTGTKSMALVKTTADQVAKNIAAKPSEVFIASTGVIGEALEKNAIAQQLTKLQTSDWLGGAKAIATTDTFPKIATTNFIIDGKTYRLNGMAKGSGMIAPNMATMLCFMATDCPLPKKWLQKILHDIVDDSFNAITVDSDTSTSDSLLLFAPQHKKNLSTSQQKIIIKAVKNLCHDLALQIVKDGEGAEKFITIEITKAKTKSMAKQIAFGIANSPLVKTAIAGEDANWGRVVMAIGKTGIMVRQDKLEIYFGKHLIAKHGEAYRHYDETAVSQYLKTRDIHIKVVLNDGAAAAKVFTCDLTHGYIDINADYRS